MVGFLLLVVSNVCRMELTQVVWLSCGLGEDCVVVGMDKIEGEAMDVCSLSDEYNNVKRELDIKRQEVGDLEKEVKALKKTVARLEGR